MLSYSVVIQCWPLQKFVRAHALFSFSHSGYEGLIKNLMLELPRGSVTYNQPVRCVHWNNAEQGRSPVTVECHDGQTIAADHVVVTVPLGGITSAVTVLGKMTLLLFWVNGVCSDWSGYLKKHHSTFFHPPLPLHKIHSVQRLGFGTNNKIFAEFDSPWWDANCEIIYLLWEDEVQVFARAKFQKAKVLHGTLELL